MPNNSPNSSADQFNNFISEAERVQIDNIIEVSYTKGKKESCEENCETGLDIASAACTLLENPIAVAVCLRVAREAYEECNDHC
ncbi:hypothetical protein P4679_31615 [Priestia megaterium]|uniref:hypothetical protein n=1 Tax=Priestia megaterium TaxID=1404 RepID=UPI002E1C5E03|nr:hypothetical protein [Priestia megaterium]